MQVVSGQSKQSEKLSRALAALLGRVIPCAPLVILLATVAHAQNSQFVFDPNGNLFVQTAEASAPPQIIGQPQNRIVAPGEATSFFVVAADTRALTYQWRFNGTNIGGATNDALLRQNVSTNNEGSYAVVLTNPSGSVTSAPALLIIDSDADGVPDSWELANFGNLTNSATTDADGDGSSNLQEFLDGTNPADANSVLRHITIVRDGGSVIASPNQAGYTNGQTVTLTATSLSGEEPFHAWLGDIVTRSNSVTLVMTNNKTLYARFTPIVFTWTNFSSGDWNVAANWSPNLVPGSNDTVVIPNNGTVTLNTSADCADVTLGSAGNTPTLTGSGTLTVRGSFVWTSGTMSGTGHMVIDSGATMVAVSQSGVTLTTRTLENGGTVFWTGAGNIHMFAGAVITNRAGALFHAQNSANLSVNGGSSFGRFDNAGTFRKSASAGMTSTGAGSINFNNFGTVEIQAGTLDLSGGGTHSGSFVVPAGTALMLSGGTHTAGVSSSIVGTGQFTVSSATANLAGLVNVGGSNTFNGSAVNFTGNTICTNNTVTISGGTANFSGTGLVSPTVLNLINGELAGSGTVTVLDAMNWTAGTMSGGGRTVIVTVAPGTALALSGNHNALGSSSITGGGRTVIEAGATLNAAIPGGVFMNGRTLENGGTVLWTGAGFLVMNPPAAIINRAGALFEMQNALTITANNGLCRFDNAGTFRKSVNPGTATFPVAFNNSGTVDIRSGILLMDLSYVSSSSALLNCALGGTTPGTGYGQLHVAGAVTLNGALSVDLINGFVPKTNDAFTVLTVGTRNGTFANFLYPSNAAAMQVSNTANSVIVRVTDVFTVPQPAPVPAGLISWWRAEGNALDTFGTNHGVLTNGAAFAAGQVGQTFALDGADDYVQVPDSVSLRPASVAIEAWVKFFATNGIRIVLVKPLGTNTTFDSYGLALQDGAVLGAICDNSGFGPFLTGPQNIAAGQWYHLAYTFDDTSKQQVLYVNGLAVASGTANKTMSYDTHPVLLGADLENGVLSFFHNGQIDEASIYNRALTRDEIATIYNAGIAGKQMFTTIEQPMLFPPEISGADFKLTWTAVSNATYRVEFNLNLNPSNWTAFPGDVPGVSNTASKVDVLTPSNRFYRVRVLP